MNEATRENLRRKSAFVDRVQLHQGKPLFSFIDLSLTELCNRSAGHRNACRFCPRIDPAFYPNQALHMDLGLVERLRDSLIELDYRGGVVLCGFGEPMLHPKFERVVEMLSGQNWRLELVTNGDRLTRDLVLGLRAQIDCFVVSMYDGPHQALRFREMFDGLAPGEDYILRDRWHTEEDAFGLKLTNRAGTVSAGRQDPVLPDRPCHYLAYQLAIDWNGDVLLCVQDWHKKVKFGNVATQPLIDIWTSPALHKRRMALIGGRRCAAPCNGCNTDGTLHGFNHAPLWGQAPAHDHRDHRTREIA